MAGAACAAALWCRTISLRGVGGPPPGLGAELIPKKALFRSSLKINNGGTGRAHIHNHNHRVRVFASISSEPRTTVPDHLVDSIISQVTQTDRGVLLTSDEHKKVAEVVQELRKHCVDKPVTCPLIFGEWDVVYCSVPTSPGGGYRSALGRLIFKTKEMIQGIEAPDIVRNKVSFSAFGFLDGEVSLEGKLKALDERWIQVVFEAPELKVGGLEFKYGGQSEVKLEITYIDDNIRLGMGSRGSLFVFQRRSTPATTV